MSREVASSVDVQTRLLAGSLESQEARQFLESMPMVTVLMPLFTPAEVQDTSGAPLLIGGRGASDKDDL